ncbi:MAG: type 1 glutamine amidotransferase [Spirochaetes bacterium]|nr:type 1 glutamine amidotransferase [Spirochaetota bacterium]
MRIHFIKHVPFEGPALIGEWAVANDFSTSLTELYLSDSLPDINLTDWVVVMGGPMNVYQYDKYPWLRLEDAVPEELTVFHWHGDTFGLPGGAVNLAESKGCKNQVFLYGDRVLAVQFHLEMRKENILNIIKNSSGDITPGKYVRTEEEMLRDTEKYQEPVQKTLYEILNRLKTTSTG